MTERNPQGIAMVTQSTAEYVEILGLLADQAVDDGHYGLQNVCLLIAEALAITPTERISSELSAVLEMFPSLFNAYHNQPGKSAHEIINILRDPGLAIELTEEEFALLEIQLMAVGETPEGYNGPILENAEDVGKHIEIIGRLAGQADIVGNFALQDACLLLAEALAQAPAESLSPELLSVLDIFPALFDGCTRGSSIAVQEILNLLREPCLGLGLAEDELTELETRLLPVDSGAEGQALAPQIDPGIASVNLETIAQLAGQAAEAGHFVLQDACLLIVEAIEQTPAALLVADLAAALAGFTELFNNCAKGSAAAARDITNILRHPCLQLALVDDEFDELESQLAAFAAPPEGEPQAQTPATPGTEEDLAKHLDTVVQLAEESGKAEQFALQDACLLIAEALDQATTDNLEAEFLAVFEYFPTLVKDCAAGSAAAARAIINVIRNPSLRIDLAEDEFASLESQMLGVEPEPVADEQVDALNSQWAESVEPLKPIEGDSGSPEGIPMDYAVGFDSAGFGSTGFGSAQPTVTSPQPTVTSPQPAEAALMPTPPLSKAMLELVGLLQMEATLVEELLATINPNEAGVGTKLQHLGEELERYASASQVAGFAGLALICQHVGSNVQAMRADADMVSADHLDLLNTWLGNVKTYLSIFHEPDAGLPVLAQLGASDWPLPIGLDAAGEILVNLKTAATDVEDDGAESRKQLVTPEDVSLTLPSDVNQELLDILLHELPVQTQQFSSAVQNLQKGGSQADLELAQRVAHTIKGAANTVGIKGIAELTHSLEDILVACTEHNSLPSGDLLGVLMDAADCLEGMTEHVTGLSQPPQDALTVLQNVLDWANRIDAEGFSQVIAESSAPAAGLEAAEKTAVQTPETSAEANEKQPSAMLRVAADQMEDLFRQAGENIILNNQANERMRRVRSQLLGMHNQFDLIRQLGDELEQFIDLRDLSGRALNNVESEFDALEMDQYNELHTASRRMVEAAFDVREMTRDASKELEEMGRLLEDQQRVANETQEVLMKTRLVPVSSIIHRLQRGLRQTCRITGKQCDLSVSGEELMVDGDILNAMIEPLMHLLRNSVDHGIETEAERLASGKAKTGLISIDFDREGNSVLVRCRDDGRGLDFAAIRAAAEKRGVVGPGQAISEDELKRFILRPNFSTRTQTTQISGRGVGMDVVHFQVLEMGGTLALHSEAGRGLSVDLKIPLPLSRSHALLVNTGPYRVAIISKGIRQILYPTAGEILSLENGKQALLLDGETYPMTTLSDLLHIPASRRSPQIGAVLLVEEDNLVTAVQINAVTGSLDLVIKGLGEYIKKIPGFAGAAILGDGSVASVLDLPELLRYVSTDTEYADYEMPDAGDADQGLPTVLVVDDSVSQRRALEQLLTDVGFQIRSARDGMEAVEMLAHFRPDIVLTDMEMPRMNGIEMTAHIRAKENLKGLPIIMITSRATQKHRKLAEDSGVDVYLTKPVREDDLLANMQNLLQTN